MRVRRTTRSEHGGAGTDRIHVVADLEDVVALEDVEELVLAFVNVSGRVERRDLLDDRERAVRRVCRRAQNELGIAEAEPLAFRGAQRIRRDGVGHVIACGSGVTRSAPRRVEALRG